MRHNLQETHRLEDRTASTETGWKDRVNPNGRFSSRTGVHLEAERRQYQGVIDAAWDRMCKRYLGDHENSL